MTVKTIDEAVFNDEGFLVDPMAWTPELAQEIASREGLELTDRHWLVIDFNRKEYEASGVSPTLRRVTKGSGVDTKEFYKLFPGAPAKMAAMVSGLPKPTGCI